MLFFIVPNSYKKKGVDFVYTPIWTGCGEGLRLYDHYLFSSRRLSDSPISLDVLSVLFLVTPRSLSYVKGPSSL